MSLFTKILEKIGIRKKETTSQSAPATLGAKSTASVKPASAAVKPGLAAPTAPGVKPAAISEVDVVKKLEGLSKGKKLDWKVSIVDLLKLLDLDSSFEARKELATELGCPAELMGDSAKMNVWLHKTVLKKIAENGGNIPRDLFD